MAGSLADDDLRNIYSNCGFGRGRFNRHGALVVHVGERLDHEFRCGLRRDVDLEWTLHFG